MVLPGLAIGAVAQSLGEAAKREAERRGTQQVEKPATVHSGEDLANAKGGTYNQMTSPSTPDEERDVGAAGGPGRDGPAVSTTSTPSTATAGDPAPAGMPSGEAGWRNRMQQARDRVSRLEKEVATLDAQEAREDLAEAKRALTSLEEEARRSGVPQGWLR